MDEIHIEYDILSNTESGINQIRERMAKIFARIKLQEIRYKDLQQEYFALKPKIDKAAKIKEELEESKNAGKIEVRKHIVAIHVLGFALRAWKRLNVCSTYA